MQLCDIQLRNQLRHFGPKIHRYTSIGLRVNTHISNIRDRRYDPARRHSKLGIPLRSVPEVLASAPVAVSGLHFHTNADSEDLGELESNVEALTEVMVGTRRFDWVNFGGGYLFGEVTEFEPLKRAVAQAKRYLADEVLVEPGAGLVRAAGYLVSSVIDIFDRYGTQVVVLDTSVNHLPKCWSSVISPKSKAAP